MSSAPERRPVTIEDLLRLKRAERPPAEFWPEWDRQLRTKQLAASLDKRPWWRDALPRLGLALGRYHLPLGATAILALTILTVREYRSVNTELSAPVATPVARVGAPSVMRDGTDTGSFAELRQPTTVARDEVEAASAEPQEISRAVSLLPTTRDSIMDAMSRPAAREIAANLAIARATDPALARILKSAAGYELSAPRVQVEEPLARVAALHDTRQGRLQVYSTNAAYAPDTNPAVSRFHDRQVSHLSEDQLYEAAAHRIGAAGDRAWLKF
jgi:hypothetical protein